MALLKVKVNILNNIATLIRVLKTNPFAILGIIKEFKKSLGKR
jgi:hypothetical protein